MEYCSLLEINCQCPLSQNWVQFVYKWRRICRLSIRVSPNCTWNN